MSNDVKIESRLQSKIGAEPAVPKAVLKKVRLLELKTRLAVQDVFGGTYNSVFKGQGMDFAEVRQYYPGDDIRSIDWNVSARMGHPFIKIYREERELTVMLAVDVSASNDYGTVESLKREIAGELTALLAMCALTNNDKVGLLLFSDRVEHFVAPKKGRRHILRLIRDVLVFKPESKGTSISTALEYSLHALRKKSVIFLISDMIDEGYEKAVKVANNKHDLIVIELHDPRESEIIPAGLIPLYDGESDRVIWTDTSSKKFRQKYSDRTKAQIDQRKAFFKSIGVDRINLQIDQPYFPELVKFFKAREHRR